MLQLYGAVVVLSDFQGEKYQVSTGNLFGMLQGMFQASQEHVPFTAVFRIEDSAAGYA